MNQTDLITEMQTAIDEELHVCIRTLLQGYPDEYISMFTYQMGWKGEKSGKDAQGKRIRPLLVLLVCHACGGDWHKALPAAAAVELVHNFSLIHDDIQDRSETRRGRSTIWVKWGEAQAINAGDAMLTVAQLSLMKLSGFYIPPVVLQAVNILQSACLKLTRGQHLDIAFEKLDVLPLDLYWQMVDGKTSSLLSACMAIGALLGGVDESVCNGMSNFGSKIGAAFQVQDDWLGVWGNDDLLGKSTSSDLITRKKTYPILLGIMKKKEFSRVWNSMKIITYTDSQKLANLLRQDGVEEETRSQFEVLYNEAFSTFNEMKFDPQQAAPLRTVIEGLFGRIK